MIDLINSLSIEQFETLLKFSKIFLEKSLNEENIQEKWKNPKFKLELIDLIEKVKLWKSNEVDLVEFEIVDNDDYPDGHEYIFSQANNFQMFLAMGSKGIIEYIEKENGKETYYIDTIKKDIFQIKKVFDEITQFLNGGEIQITNPIIYFHLSGSEERDIFNDDYY
jgi:hypothetical protein